MKKMLMTLWLMLVAGVCGAMSIDLPPGVTYTWEYDVVELRNMDAKPIFEPDGTFSWELLNTIMVTKRGAMMTPQPTPFATGTLRVVNAELVAAGIVEGIPWGTSTGMGQAMVIQRAFVTKVATLLEIPEPTKSVWIEAVLGGLRAQ